MLRWAAARAVVVRGVPWQWSYGERPSGPSTGWPKRHTVELELKPSIV